MDVTNTTEKLFKYWLMFPADRLAFVKIFRRIQSPRTTIPGVRVQLPHSLGSLPGGVPNASRYSLQSTLGVLWWGR